MAAEVTLDHADMAACVAWQPGVRRRMNVPGADAIARLELGRRGRRASEFAAHHDALDIIKGELAALERLGRFDRVTRGDFPGGDVALVDQQVFEPEQPFLIV